MLEDTPQLIAAETEELHPADLADVAEAMAFDQIPVFLAALPKERAASILEYLDEELRAEVLEAMSPEKAAELVSAMTPDERADVLEELDEDHADEIVEEMPAEARRVTEQLRRYEPDTAGGLMTTEFVAVSEDLTAQQCIEELRRMEPDAESIYYVFVVDGQQHLRGVLSLRDLIVAPPDRPIRDIMIRNVVAVRLDASAEEVAAVLSKYNLLAVPVVDDEDHLRGIVTVDDALDEVLPDSVKRKLPRVF
jgi:magnesium transporter